MGIEPPHGPGQRVGLEEEGVVRDFFKSGRMFGGRGGDKGKAEDNVCSSYTL